MRSRTSGDRHGVGCAAPPRPAAGEAVGQFARFGPGVHVRDDDGVDVVGVGVGVVGRDDAEPVGTEPVGTEPVGAGMLDETALVLAPVLGTACVLVAVRDGSAATADLIICRSGMAAACLPANQVSMNSCHVAPGRSRPYSA